MIEAKGDLDILRERDTTLIIILFISEPNLANKVHDITAKRPSDN